MVCREPRDSRATTASIATPAADLLDECAVAPGGLTSALAVAASRLKRMAIPATAPTVTAVRRIEKPMTQPTPSASG